MATKNKPNKKQKQQNPNMRLVWVIIISLLQKTTLAQIIVNQPLYIPDTLVTAGDATNRVYNLSMRTGTHQWMPGYDGASCYFDNTVSTGRPNVLGPTLIMYKRDSVTINVTNSIGQQTTVHWHGLHVSPENDGGPHSVIEPNTTWSPSFKVRDHASTYWYHPHLHEKTTNQVLRGLAGMIIVKNDLFEPNLPRRYGVDDIPLIIQSKQMDGNEVNLTTAVGCNGGVGGSCAQNNDDHLFVNGMPAGQTTANDFMIYTNERVINNYINARRQIIRLRILNGSPQRVYNLGLSDNSHFLLIGTDGGLRQTALSLNRIQVAPGERVEILVDLTAMSDGSTLAIKNYGTELVDGQFGASNPYKSPTSNFGNTLPGYNATMWMNNNNFNILKIFVNGAAQGNENWPGSDITTLPTSLYNIANTPLTSNDATTSTEIVKYITTPWLFATNGTGTYSNHNTDDPYNEGVINNTITLDDTRIWTIYNNNWVDHPIHIHGVNFNILEVGGVSIGPSDYRYGRKDVVVVPAHSSAKFIAKFKDFTSETPYMFHCHIGVHEDRGMMHQFKVVSDAVVAPSISTATSANSVCAGVTKSYLTYFSTIGNPTQYSISWPVTHSIYPFVHVSFTDLPSSMIPISIPANAIPGTYTGTIKVKDANGVTSSGTTFTITILPNLPNNGGGASFVFVGDSTPAFTNAQAGGTWSIEEGIGRASITTDGVVTGLTSGAVYVKYTYLDGVCGTTSRSLLNIFRIAPFVSNTGGATKVCVNRTTAAFINNQPGGAWSIIPGTGTASITNEGIVTGLTAGTVSVVYTYYDGVSNNSVTSLLTVNDTPSPIVFGASSCGAGSLTLGVLPIAGLIPSWYASPTVDTSLLSNAENFVTGNISTSSTYYASFLNTVTGCVSSRKAVFANINPINSSITNRSLCANLLPYNWNGFSFSSAGIYSVTLNNVVGCDSIATLNLEVTSVNNNAKLFVSNNNINVGNVVTFAAYDSIYTINIPASKDNSIYMDASNNSNGIGTSLFVGNNGTNSPRRSLIRFDLTPIPTGSAIKNVNLKLNCNSSGSSSNVSIYKLLSNWGEGTSNATTTGGGGAGVSSTLNDATWNCSFANGIGSCNSLWSNAGGDYSSTPSASTLVSTSNTNYNWSDINMIPVVQSWVNNPSENFGWLIKGNEDAAGTAKRFGSRENADFSQRPVLTVSYFETGLNYTFKINGVTVQSGPSNIFSSSNLHNGDVVFCSITKYNMPCASITNNILMNVVDTIKATLNVKAFLQGSYLSSGRMRSTLNDLEINNDTTTTDSLQINLWSILNLNNSNPDYSSKVILHNNGIATAIFPSSALGKNYYVAIKHRNSIETWSASPILLSVMTNYDFTNNINSAYDDEVNPPMSLATDGKFLLYSGDINQDGGIDIFDMQIAENNAAQIVFGYHQSDCNGDLITDIFDLQIVENNASMLLYYIRPQ